MDYTESIFQRIDLQQLRSFVLNGVEDFDSNNYTYQERLRKGDSSIYARLETIYPDENNFDKAVADLSKALIAHEEVYTEIGMKAGARIVFQLLQMDDVNLKASEMSKASKPTV